MANYLLRFYDLKDGTTIQVEKLKHDNIIQIVMIDEDGTTIIDLDKSTAIKLAKTLRTEINKITESEGEDGRR